MIVVHHSATSSTVHSVIGFCDKDAEEGVTSSEPLLRSDCDGRGIVSCLCNVAAESTRLDAEFTGVSCGGVFAP